MSDVDKDKLEKDLIKWKMRTAISMGILRRFSSMMPEGTEYGDMVRKAIKDIEELT